MSRSDHDSEHQPLPERAHDPRREPSEAPEAGHAAVPSVLPLVGVGTSTSSRRDGSTDVVILNAPIDARSADEESDLPLVKGDPSAARREQSTRVTSQDPRVADIERLLDAGNWRGVVDELGPPADAGRLPPNLGLAYALARRETLDEQQQLVADEGEGDPTRVAIRCMAALLAVDTESPLAMVLAKRMLRKNPVSWRQRQAPAPVISLTIVVVGILLGAAMGYLVSAGYVRIQLPG